MNLVMVPFHDWKKSAREGFRTRDGHFLQEFSKNPVVEKLLIINRPISIAEMLLYRRNWRPNNSINLYQKNGVCISQIGEKTFTVDVLILEMLQPTLMRRAWTPYIFGQRKVITAVNHALSYLDMVKKYSLFISAPIFVPLIKELNPTTLIFDAQDNLLQHAMYKSLPHLEVYYEYCLENADYIYANSKETIAWFQQARPDAHHIANGVDSKTFDSSKTYSVPHDIQHIPSPIVGYAGKMQEMFDVELMINIASKMKDVSFVFIGQQLNKQWMKPLWQLPNIYYLGDKHYQSLPNYLSAFDICIIPYSVERQHGGDPIKFYEYLSMGKPIVTTNIGNVGDFRDYPFVCIADSSEDFYNGLKDLLKKNLFSNSFSQSSVPDYCLWQTKAEKILSDISDKLDTISLASQLPHLKYARQ